MNVSDFSLLAVLIHRVVNIAFGHFRHGAHAKFQRIAATGREIDQALIHVRLIDQARLLAHRRHRGIVRMGGQTHARFFRDWHHFFQESLQAPPEFVVGDRRQISSGSLRVVNHIPDRPIRDGHIFRRAVHPQSNRVAPALPRGHAPAHSGQTEVVSQHRNARVSQPPNECFYFFDLLRALRAIQQNVVPVRRIDIFNRSQDQSRIFDVAAEGLQFRDGPKFFWIAGEAPRFVLSAAGLIVPRIRRDLRRTWRCPLVEVIHQMHHHVRATGLARKIVIIARQHVPVEPESDLHSRFPIPPP